MKTNCGLSRRHLLGAAVHEHVRLPAYADREAFGMRAMRSLRSSRLSSPMVKALTTSLVNVDRRGSSNGKERSLQDGVGDTQKRPCKR